LEIFDKGKIGERISLIAFVALFTISSSWAMEEKVYPPLNSHEQELLIEIEPQLSIEAQKNGYVPELFIPRLKLSSDKDKTNPSIAQKKIEHKIYLTKEIIGKLSGDEEQDIIVVFEDSDIFSKFKNTNWRKDSRNEKKHKLKNLVTSFLELKQPVFSLLSKHSAALKQDYSHLPISLLKVKNISSLNAIAQSPIIKAIYQNDMNHLYLDQSLPLINQPEAFTLGATGEGTTVAILDTGIDYTHPAFGSCISPDLPSDCKVVFAQDFTPLDDGEIDAHGHGTNVSGIVLGVAPGTKLAVLDVFTGSGAYTSHIIAAIDWIVANQSTYNIVAANLSLGSSSNNPSECTNSWATVPFERLRAVDVLPIVAAGNDSFKNGLADPACAPGAIRAGAVYDDDFGTLGWMGCTDYSALKGSVTCFSNSSDYLTLLAPGAMITSAGLKMSGTSMAAPHVAGAIAVLRGDGAFPDETLNATVEHLTNTGTPIIDSGNGLSHPLINLEAALLDGLPNNPPEIQSFSPSIGREKTPITILGNNFFKVTSVKFGGMDADSYDVISSNIITAIVGSGNTGLVTVVAQSGTGSKPGFVFNSSQLVSITNIPETATLTSPNETLSINVQGHYSDETSTIVTASSTFYSTDPAIVAVDERGIVTVKGEGTVNVFANIGELSSATQINVDITSIVDRELEPNNSIINANPVDISERVYRGNLSDSSDIDNYIITIPSSIVLTILIKPNNDTYTGGVIRASIIDSNGTIYSAKKISSDTSDFVNLSAALINPGTYYLRIDKLGYYSVFTKDYEFLVQSNDDPIFFVKRELEPNDSFGQAMLYSTDAGSLYGQLSSTEDIDVYAYDLTTGVFLLNVKPENDDYDGGVIVVSIQDSYGNVLSMKEVVSTEPTYLTLTSRIDTSGRYYVVVNRKQYYAVFDKDYELLVNFEPDDSDNDGMPDYWENQHDLNPLVDDASGDVDNDGYTNLEEYQLGSDPTDRNDPEQQPVKAMPWIPLLLLDE